MTFSTTSQIINGVRRTVLIICTDEPYTPDDVSVIRQTIETGNEITYIDWHNAQTVLYKQNLEQDGKYYSWMIVDHKDVNTMDNPAYYRAEADELLNLLGNAAELEYMNAMEEIENV